MKRYKHLFEQVCSFEKGHGGIREQGVRPLEEVPSDTIQPPKEAGDAVRPAVRSGGTGTPVHDEGTGGPELQSSDRLSRSGGSSTSDVDTSTRYG